MRRKANKLLSVLLALVLVLSLAPAMSQTAQAYIAFPGIVLGNSDELDDTLMGGQQSAVYFGTYNQSPDGSGDFNKDPIKWRVLSNAEGKLFLLSDQNLDVFRYHTEYESVTWEKSTMRSWLNGYAASENTGGDSGTDYSGDNFIKDAFDAKELAAIAETVVENPDNGITPGGNNTTDKVFLLSIAEARNSGYGFTDDNRRISTNTGYVQVGGKIHFDEGINNTMNGVGDADRWWLRSPGAVDSVAANVYINGFVETGGHSVRSTSIAVRPALNLNLNSVLFTSAADYGKAGTTGELSEIGEYTGNEWKLTLLDADRQFAVTEASATGAPGGTVTLNYTGATVYDATTAPNEYISAILTDENGNLLRYGRLAQPTSADGKVDVKIPAGLADGTYTLKVFSEQYNGALFIDYASAFDDVTLTVDRSTPAVTEYDVWIGGVQVTSENMNDIPSVTGGTAVFTPDANDPKKGVLTFDGVTGIDGSYQASVSNSSTASIYVGDMTELTFKGDAKITKDISYEAHVILSGKCSLIFDGNFELSGGKLTQSLYVPNPGSGSGGITVSGGSLRVESPRTSSYYPVSYIGSLTVEKGAALTVVSSSTAAAIAIAANPESAEIVVDGGTLTVEAKNGAGVSAKKTTVKDGALSVSANSIGVNGALTVTGGTVEAIGATQAFKLAPDLSGYTPAPYVLVNTETRSESAQLWNGSDPLGGSNSSFKYVKIAPADDGAVQVKKSGGDDDFAADAPIATVRIDHSKLTKENVKPSYSANNNVDKFELNNGEIWAKKCAIDADYRNIGGFTLAFADAALLPDGTKKTLEIVFDQITVIRTSGAMGYFDDICVARITGDPNGPIAFSPLTSEQRHMALRAEVTFKVNGVDEKDVFLFDARGINNVRGDQNFGSIVNASAHYNYSESMEPASGVVAGSHLYLPADSALRVETGSSSPSLGYRFVGSGARDVGFNHGFAAAADAKKGFQSRVWSSAGTNQFPLEIFFLGGGLSHDLTVSSGDGGKIELWSDGRLDSASAQNLPGGTLGTPYTYDVPNGKPVTLKMTPDSRYELDKLYVNGEETAATEVTDSAGAVSYYTYTFDADKTGPQEISATWRWSFSPGDIWVGGVLVTDENKDNVLGVTDANGTPTVVFTPADGENPAKLTLTNANVSGALLPWGEYYGIYSTIGLTLELNGESSVTAPSLREHPSFITSCGIRVLGDLTIDGTGSLTAAGGEAALSSGIVVDGSMTVKGGTVTATSNAQKIGTVEPQGKAIVCNALTVEKGTVTAADSSGYGAGTGVLSASGVTIKGGTVTATGKNFGLMIYSNNTPLIIEDGTVSATGGVCGVYSFGEAIIKGGTVTASGEQSAFFSTPDLSQYPDPIATVSSKEDGSQAEIWDGVTDLTTYKYVSISDKTAAVWWRYDGDTKTLHISGEEKDGYIHFPEAIQAKVGRGNPIPWQAHRAEVELAVIEGEPAPVSTVWWFAYMGKLKEIQNLTALDTSKVTDMSSMFMGSSALAPLDVSGFDTSKVKYMAGMFLGCSSLIVLDVSGFDMSQVGDVTMMFYNCSSLETIYAAPGTDWWRDQSEGSSAQWSQCDNMFYGCSSLVGGSGTEYDTPFSDADYARVDGLDGKPGYFTAVSYGIELTPQSLDFGSAAYGYSAPAAQPVGISNTGNQSVSFDIDPFTLQNFELIPYGTLGQSGEALQASGNPLSPFAAVSFQLKPKADLAPGTYSETITVAWQGGRNESGSESVTVTFEVEKAPLTLGLSIAGWAYGEAANDPVLTGNAGNGAVTYEYKLTAADDAAYRTTVPTAAGEYTVRAAVAATANYKSGAATAEFIISRKAATVTANDASKTYGQADPTLTATVTGLVGSDTVSYTISRAAGENAGTYAITPSGEAAQGNYTVSFAPGTFTIEKAPLTLSLSIAGWAYGEAANDPVLTGNAGNGAVTYEYKLTAADDAAYRTTVPTAVGEYTVRAAVAETANYKGGAATAEFTISPRQFSVGPSTYAITVVQPENGSVTVSRTTAASGTRVIVTVTPNEGYETDTVKVTDRSGREIAVTKNDDGTYTFTMPGSKVNVTATLKAKAHDCPSVHLKDVDENAWYHEYVDCVVEKGLMQGVADDRFAPNAATSRAMIVTILYRLEGRPAVSGASPFADVASGQWYTDAIIWANSKGIVEGYGGGKFGPNDPITREQMAAILYRYAQYKGSGFTGAWMFLLDYEDVEQMSEWADEAMQWCVMNGIITGRTTTTLAPKGEATRAEAAAILKRFIENVK